MLDSRRQTLVRALVTGAALACLLTGCTWFRGSDDLPMVTLSKAKIYGDDQVFKTFGERRKGLRALHDGINASDAQEIRHRKHAGRQDLALDVQLPGSGASAEKPALPSGDVTPPATPEGTVGRRHADILNDLITRDQDITAYELLYLGDSKALDDEMQVALVRIDVSINSYCRTGAKPKFVVAEFGAHWLTAIELDDVTSGKKDPTPKKGEECIVYYLAPETSSIVSNESVVNSLLKTRSAQLGGNIKGVDAKAAMRTQQYLADEFLTLVERPIQYAIYKEAHNKFAFAFGPRRHMVMRGWLNPKRWYSGNPYRMEYEISPGPRDCYAVVIFPKRAEALHITGEIRDKLLGATDARAFEVAEQKETSLAAEAAKAVMYMSNFVGVSERVVPFTPKSKVWTFDKKSLLRSQAPAAGKSTVAPSKLFPYIANTLYIESDTPVSAESEVIIGHVGIPRANVSVMGRYLLKVDVPADKGLQKLVENKTTTAMVRVITPGSGVKDIKDITLVKTESVKKPIAVSIMPLQGSASEAITLELRNLTPAEVTAVIIGGRKATKVRPQGATKLLVDVPDIPVGKGITKVRVWVEYTKDRKPGSHLVKEPFEYVDNTKKPTK